jgi:nicotinamide riboside kinase
MESLITLSRDMVELSNTIKEGLDHLDKRLADGHLEDSYYLFQDIIQAFYSVTRAMESIQSSIEIETVVRATDKLLNAFEKLSISYEDQKLNQARMDLQLILSPAFSAWSNELHRCLQPIMES